MVIDNGHYGHFQYLNPMRRSDITSKVCAGSLYTSNLAPQLCLSGWVPHTHSGCAQLETLPPVKYIKKWHVDMKIRKVDWLKHSSSFPHRWIMDLRTLSRHQT